MIGEVITADFVSVLYFGDILIMEALYVGEWISPPNVSKIRIARNKVIKGKAFLVSIRPCAFSLRRHTGHAS
jgi:hypothetical protein